MPAIVGAGDKTVKMWTLADGGSCVRTFEGHIATVLRASFATSGTQVGCRILSLLSCMLLVPALFRFKV